MKGLLRNQLPCHYVRSNRRRCRGPRTRVKTLVQEEEHLSSLVWISAYSFTPWLDSGTPICVCCCKSLLRISKRSLHLTYNRHVYENGIFLPGVTDTKCVIHSQCSFKDAKMCYSMRNEETSMNLLSFPSFMEISILPEIYYWYSTIFTVTRNLSVEKISIHG